MTDRPTVEEALQELWADLPGHYPIEEHLDAIIAAARREGAQQTERLFCAALVYEDAAIIASVTKRYRAYRDGTEKPPYGIAALPLEETPE